MRLARESGRSSGLCWRVAWGGVGVMVFWRAGMLLSQESMGFWDVVSNNFMGADQLSIINGNNMNYGTLSSK